MYSINKERRFFLKKAAFAGMGFALSSKLFAKNSNHKQYEGKRIGMIGLDTSHCIAFTQAMNAAQASAEWKGYKVVAAYPKGSNDIQSSVERIPGYTADVQKLGVEIVGSIQELLTKVDFILLETNDGRLHLEQALEVIKSGKPMFIDKPIAASLSDAIAIFEAAAKNKVPIFSSSSLRFTPGAQEISKGKIGKVFGADAYSPLKFEKTHPDLFWYGIHGVEILYTLMGTGCKSLKRIVEPDNELVIGTWNENRVGTFRGIINGKQTYGGTAYGQKEVAQTGPYIGYNPLLTQIIAFFETGIPPVTAAETLEIYAFMEAADESKKNGGASVSIEEMFNRAKLKK